MIGVPELVVVAAVIFLLFGGKALSSMGKGIGEFVSSVRNAGDKREDQ